MFMTIYIVFMLPENDSISKVDDELNDDDCNQNSDDDPPFRALSIPYLEVYLAMIDNWIVLFSLCFLSKLSTLIFKSSQLDLGL